MSVISNNKKIALLSLLILASGISITNVYAQYVDVFPIQIELANISVIRSTGQVAEISMSFKITNPNTGSFVVQALDYQLFETGVSETEQIANGVIGNMPDDIVKPSSNYYTILGEDSIILKDKITLRDSENTAELWKILQDGDQAWKITGNVFYNLSSKISGQENKLHFEFIKLHDSDLGLIPNKLQEENVILKKQLDFQDISDAIKQDYEVRSYQIFKEISNQENMLNLMGEDKVAKYKKFFEGLKSKNIMVHNPESLLSSDKITLEERKIAIRYYKDVLQVMKTVLHNMNDEHDKILQEVIFEINQKELSKNNKSQLIKDIQLDADVKKNQMLNIFSETIEPLENILEKEKTTQGIIAEFSNESPVLSNGGGCLVATAAFGTELAPQVQKLREIRDNILLNTSAGTAFVTGFNQLYYLFSPTVADWQRENPIFKDSVKIILVPMLTILSVLTLVEEGSESQVLGVGLSVIVLNLGIYVATPTLMVFKILKHYQQRKLSN